jgi:hypothetical protein
MVSLLGGRRGFGCGLAALPGAAALLIALALTPSTARGVVTTNPANRAVLLSQPIEELRYDHAERCMRNPKPGLLALQAWLQRHWRGAAWGIVRCEKLSRRTYSVHSEGRALDWHLDAGVPAERRAAQRLIEMLLGSDRAGNQTALARRMGVQGIIFNCRQWYGYSEHLSPYSYCYRRDGKLRNHLNRTLAHRDHLHIELNWAGAGKRTSFWRSPLAP